MLLTADIFGANPIDGMLTFAIYITLGKSQTRVDTVIHKDSALLKQNETQKWLLLEDEKKDLVPSFSPGLLSTRMLQLLGSMRSYLNFILATKRLPVPLPLRPYLE